MSSRHTEKIIRVDLRIPKELYERIQTIAVSKYRAKIHHRSGQPEISPTVLELIKIGITHLESTKQAIEESTKKTAGKELGEQIEQLDLRLTAVENKLSGVESSIVQAEAGVEPLAEEGLSDSELGILINLSSALIRRYRVEGKAHQGVVERLKEWEAKSDCWRKKREVFENNL